MRTFGQNKSFESAEDQNDFRIKSQLVLCNIRVGETIEIGQRKLTFLALTKKRITYDYDGVKISFHYDWFEKHTDWLPTRWPNLYTRKGFDAVRLFRDIESDLILDSINSLNLLHELTDCSKILKRENYVF